MWVEVIWWRGNKIRWLRSNPPFNIPGLQAGQKVEILEEKVFDYSAFWMAGWKGTRRGS